MTNYTDNGFTVSTDKNRLQQEVIHGFLSKSYWSKGISMERVQRSISNSLCFGVYHHDKQVGFARVITDYTRFAYLADVFILESHQGKGLSKWLMKYILEYPELQELSKWMLGTADAHGLYSQFGFSPIENPGRFMELIPNK